MNKVIMRRLSSRQNERHESTFFKAFPVHNLRELAHSPIETREIAWRIANGEAIMINANTRNGHTEDRPLADSELDAVNGGTKGSGSWLQAVAQSLGQAMDKQAQNVSSVVAR
jgi:hypothetical protein